MVLAGLTQTGREDLIGNGQECLIRRSKPEHTGEPSKKESVKRKGKAIGSLSSRLPYR